MAFLQRGRSQAEIAGTLNRSKSIISREIRRNSFEGEYDPCNAQVTAMTRRKSAEKVTKQNPEVLQAIRKWLRPGWSTEFISYRFSVELPLQKHVCQTTIYDWIYKDRQKGGKLHTYLPRYGKRRWKGGKRKRAGGSLIPDRVDIAERPQIGNQRKRLGHWEGDTVYGQNASLVTLVESAFAAHSKINKRHSIDVFFAKRYAGWQRGTNENTNGRLKRLWPKKIAMATLSQEERDNGVLGACRRKLFCPISVLLAKN